MNDIRRAGYTMMEAIAYGDAAGLPFESLDALEIEQRYRYIRELRPANTHPFFNEETTPGCWSDDTQLSLAVAEGLIAADGFDVRAQAESFLKEYQATPRITHGGKQKARGWGGSTINSAERLLSGVNPFASGEKDGSGNGVIIKLAPLVLWQAARGIDAAERYEQYDQLTTITHDSDIARWASRVHGDFLLRLLTSEEGDPGRFVVEQSMFHERMLGISSEGTEALLFLQNESLGLEPEKILLHTDRKGFYVPQTLAMSYGAFIFWIHAFPSLVYETVNMGGDSDSTASIVATLLNFHDKGDIIIPEDAVHLRQRERLREVSKRLTDLAMKGAAQ